MYSLSLSIPIHLRPKSLAIAPVVPVPKNGSKTISPGFDEDTIVLISQIVTEWTFHKCVDLSRSEISREYWDEIMQKIAFAVYEIAKKGFLKNIEQQRILDTVEQNVKKVWEEEIDDLVSQNKLSKEAGNKAKQLSNIDDMAKREG